MEETTELEALQEAYTLANREMPEQSSSRPRNGNTQPTRCPDLIVRYDEALRIDTAGGNVSSTSGGMWRVLRLPEGENWPGAPAPVPEVKVEAIPITKPEKVVDRDKYSLPFPKIQELANSLFGEQNVDMVKTDFRTWRLTILFPIINITNSADEKHIIKDLYVTIRIQTDREEGDNKFDRYSINLRGTRGCVTMKEYEYCYAHSHLPSGFGGDPNAFCIGQGAFANLQTQLSRNPLEDNWMLYLLSLPNYLSWESLEGGPHYKMRGIGSVNSSSARSILDEHLHIVLKSIPLSAFEFAGELRYIDGRPEVFTYLNAASPIKTLSSANNDSRRIQEIERGITPITFKGRSIPFKIIPEEEVVDSQAITGEVLSIYNDEITQRVNEFNKLIKYEYFKHFADKSSIGKVPVIKQTKIRSNSETTGSDRLSASATGTHGVVGRVNYA